MPPRPVPTWEHPVLSSVAAVIDRTEHVRTSLAEIERVAEWMAFESFAAPSGGPAGPFDWGDDPDRVIDATMVKATLDFAFTDFSSGVKFEVDYQGRRWSDSEAMFACLHQALVAGVPVLDGEYLAAVTRDDLDRIFAATSRCRCSRSGRRSSTRSAPSWCVTTAPASITSFADALRSCTPGERASWNVSWSSSPGLPTTASTTVPGGLPQARPTRVVVVASGGGERGGFVLRDLGAMTAFADYIVPVALRVMRVLEYTPDLEERIAAGVEIPRDSDEEIEIRAHSLYATALLTDAINQRRPDDHQLVIPQIDFRLWSAYHATTHPHHLTRTVMY